MLGERIAGYAYRHWRRHGLTQWPTVRQVARALSIRQRDVVDCEGDADYMLTGFNFHDEFCGDITVEAMTHEVDVAWCGYWLPFSRQCCCGEHARTSSITTKSKE